MKVNLVTNTTNGAGLERDARILESLLKEWGHEPHLMHFQKAEDRTTADLNIFLEVITEHKFSLAPRNWMIPNPEWWLAGGWNHLVPRFDMVLCKTRHACDLFKPMSPRRLEHVGFLSLDRLLPDVPRKPRVLHLAGKSRTKNTEAVMMAWLQHHPALELVVVIRHLQGDSPRIDNATVYHYLPDADLRRLQNECQYHLMPAQYEGWGHAYHEGLSCGAVMITTDSPPMNEFHAAHRIPGEAMGRRQQLAPMYSIRPKDVARAVDVASRSDIVKEHTDARRAYETECAYFRAKLKELLA